ncbi:hypothetical protein KM043_006575 [Ampulex compressa]|nr:hypothetical protein KM043_006575 [Ampulex compressa]
MNHVGESANYRQAVSDRNATKAFSLSSTISVTKARSYARSSGKGPINRQGGTRREASASRINPKAISICNEEGGGGVSDGCSDWSASRRCSSPEECSAIKSEVSHEGPRAASAGSSRFAVRPDTCGNILRGNKEARTRLQEGQGEGKRGGDGGREKVEFFRKVRRRYGRPPDYTPLGDDTFLINRPGADPPGAAETHRAASLSWKMAFRADDFSFTVRRNRPPSPAERGVSHNTSPPQRSSTARLLPEPIGADPPIRHCALSVVST